VNSERRKVALIQLCSPQGLCALIRVCKFSKIPLELRKLLEDPDIIKTGVTPNSDAKLLLEDYSISMNGTFDLRFLAVLTHHRNNATGLGRLSKSILDIELDKDWRVRCSDWEIEPLSGPQIEYSANDAYVAMEIFRKLYEIVKPTGMDPDSIRRFCDNYTDMKFKSKLAQMNLDPASGDASKKLLKAKR
jgi:exonuclease 3'-5' domain-containing protein 2